MTKSQIVLILGLASLAAGANRGTAQTGGDPRIAGLRSSNPTARHDAIRMVTVVGNHTDPGVMQALAQIAIRDPEEKNRVAAVHKIAQIGGMNMHTYAVLTAAASDVSPRVRQAAQQYLGAANGSKSKLPVYRVDPNPGYHSHEPVEQRLTAMGEAKGPLPVPQRRSQPPVVEWNSPIPDVYRAPEGSLNYRPSTAPNVTYRSRTQPGVRNGSMARYPNPGRRVGPQQHVVGYHPPEVYEAGPIIVPETAPESAPTPIEQSSSSVGPRKAPHWSDVTPFPGRSVPVVPAPAAAPVVAPTEAAVPRAVEPTTAPSAISEAANDWTVPFLWKRGKPTAKKPDSAATAEPTEADRAFSPPEPVMAVKSSRWPIGFSQRADTLRTAKRMADRKPDPSAGMAQHVLTEREIEPPASPSFGKKVLAAMPVFSRKSSAATKSEDASAKQAEAPRISYVGGDVVPLREADRIAPKPVAPTYRPTPMPTAPRQNVPAPTPVHRIAAQPPRTFTSLKPPAPVVADPAAATPAATAAVPAAPAVVERAVPPEIAIANSEQTPVEHQAASAVAIPKAVAKTAPSDVAPPPVAGQWEAEAPAPANASSEPSPKQAERPMDMSQRRRKAQELLAQARQRLQAGAIDEAEAILYQVHEFAIEYRRFEDSPAAVQRAIDAARERLHGNTFPVGF